MGRAGSLLGRWPHRRSRPRRPSRVGQPAVTGLTGTSPTGAPLALTLDGRKVLLFLTSSCYGCQALWAALGAVPSGTTPGNSGPGVILVTPSPTTESARDVAALAPAGRDVLMSSEAWHAFGVTAAPWFVVVADGLIAAEGAAPAAWEQIEALTVAGPG